MFLLRASVALLSLMLPLLGPCVSAQSLEPRAYTNVPVGETFIALGAIRSDGDVSPVPSSPLQDVEMTLDTGILAMAHTFAIAGKAAKIDGIAGRVCYEGSASLNGEFVEDRRCENTDPWVRLNWNFYGAPAMGLKDFVGWTPGLVVGASLQASIPVGSYTNKQIINAGANRWMLRPGIGMSYAIGGWHFDLSASIRFFEDNDDFYKGIDLEQKRLYQVQSHLVYYFPKGRWLSLDGNYYWGGETTKNGVRAGDRTKNSRWGLTFSTPLNPHHSIKLYASTGVTNPRTGGDFDNYGIAWQYRF